MDRLVASRSVKLPVIWASPPVMASRITGADCTLSSSTIARRRPRLRVVTRAKRSEPMELNEMLT